MLTSLFIQDFVLIDQADLSVEKGLTALTGETGAGKSILLDALGLATGGRAERGAVRAGAKQGVVSATFDVTGSHPVWALLEENGLDDGDDQIILRRVQNSDGRGRGFVNDRPVSIGMLRQIGETLLEIHGQHDGRGFLTAAGHRDMLDEFAGLDTEKTKLAKLYRDWRNAEEELEERRRERDATAREADYLRHITKELEELDPQADEEAELAQRRSELQASEKVAEDLAAAMSALNEGGLEGALSKTARRIEAAAAHFADEDNPLAKASTRIAAALDETMEARAAIEYAADQLGMNPEELEQVEERLFALRAAARKHGVSPDGLCAFLAKTQQALEDLAQGETAFAGLEKAAKEFQGQYQALAEKISKARKVASKKLDKAVAEELTPLKLGNARFETIIETVPDKPMSEGIDGVEFMVATNPGAPAGPLKTIASGGELSRFVLAMKAALAAKENRTVIIFDEVDAGVGGAVADAVGERLARLASDAQVLVVTHSPQVAARADTHWQIAKTQRKDDTRTNVSLLGSDQRVEEIARMLSGAEVTDEARAAAQKLLGAAPADKSRVTKRKATTKKNAAKASVRKATTRKRA